MINSTILIIDDEEDIRALLTEILKSKYNVISCGTLRSALEVVNKRKVDVVLLDLDLPDGSGFDLLEQSDNLDQDKVLIVSAHKGAQQLKTARKFGIDYFFEKPIDLLELTQTVDNLAS